MQPWFRPATSPPFYGRSHQNTALRRHLSLTWEDYVFGLVTVAFLALDFKVDLFHFYTPIVILLVVSLSFRRGLAVGAVRMAILSLTLFLARTVHGFPMHLPLMEVFALATSGIIAGALGEWERHVHETLQRSFYQTLDVLARALECRDPYTEGHSRRTAAYAVAIAREMGLDDASVTVIEQAGLLHDLGKMGMPDAILRKQGNLSPEEEQQMKLHPEEGSHILQAIPALASAALLVRHHHEHYDGSGYPDGLRDDHIPLSARILTVADAFDALTTDRPYRKASPAEVALADIQSKAGLVFDPNVVQALQNLFQKGFFVTSDADVR